MDPAQKIEELKAEIEELQHQLFEATETIEAIRTGQVDALVVQNQDGHQLYTLSSADIAYRVFIEKMTEGAITVNKDGIILYSNQQFASMVQLPLSQVIGFPLAAFIAPEQKEHFNNIFTRCWDQHCKEEIDLKSLEGTVPVQISLTTIKLETGISLSIILTDLTTQKATQQQLQIQNRQLAQINQALESSNHDLQQFASVASHDLQEPLRKIQMFSNILRERNDDTLNVESKKFLEKIVASASRMKKLIIDVLNYSKLSATDPPLTLVDLNEIVDEISEDFELMVQETGAQISKGRLHAIEVNRGQIRQVFQNIISNAIKFSKNGQAPVITISSKVVAQKSFDSPAKHDGPYCLITIMDNGIGFDEKYLVNIFGLFERLHTKDLYEGTGIGLSITKKIVEKHNGLVSARSTVGNGAEFLLLLPVSQQQ